LGWKPERSRKLIENGVDLHCTNNVIKWTKVDPPVPRTAIHSKTMIKFKIKGLRLLELHHAHVVAPVRFAKSFWTCRVSGARRRIPW
jgi:hypothetical protein